MKSFIKKFLNKLFGYINFKLIPEKEILEYKKYLFCTIKALTEAKKKIIVLMVCLV